MNIQAIYSSELFRNSSKYAWNCIIAAYYYETIRINVVENGFYTFGSRSKIVVYGFLYKNQFNPFDPSMNKIDEDRASGCYYNISMTSYLEKQATHILVITTQLTEKTGAFSIIALGPNNVTMKRSSKPICYYLK